MRELSPLFLALWVGCCLLGAAGVVWAWRSRRAHLRSFAVLSQRLGLQLELDRRTVSGRLAGREVRVWFALEPGASGDGCTLVRVDLLGVFAPDERLDAALLGAWAQQVEGQGGAEAGAQLAALSPRSQALLEEPRLRAALLASLRANDGTWIERGQLHLRRRARLRHASVLEAFLEEALALAVALSSATHGARRLERSTG